MLLQSTRRFSAGRASGTAAAAAPSWAAAGRTEKDHLHIPPVSHRFVGVVDELVNRVVGDVAGRPKRTTEATRRLVELGLRRPAGETVVFSDGERLLLLMMRDLYKRLKVEGEIDADFISEVIYGGHYWAPKWEMSGLFHDEEDDPSDVHFVGEVLDMWSFIEGAYERLDEKEKARIETETKPFGRDVRFDGFDGNNESSLLGIAKFLVNKMGRFEEFRRRDLNSHFPTVDMYKRMLAVFAPMEKSLVGRGLDADQIIRILKARAYGEESTEDGE